LGTVEAVSNKQVNTNKLAYVKKCKKTIYFWERLSANLKKIYIVEFNYAHLLKCEGPDDGGLPAQKTAEALLQSVPQIQGI